MSGPTYKELEYYYQMKKEENHKRFFFFFKEEDDDFEEYNIKLYIETKRDIINDLII